jgi:hypothetical protein
MQHIGSHFHHSYQQETRLESPTFTSGPQHLANKQKGAARESDGYSNSSIGAERIRLNGFPVPHLHENRAENAASPLAISRDWETPR